VLALTVLVAGCGEEPVDTAAEPRKKPTKAAPRDPEPSPTGTPSPTPSATTAPPVKRELIDRLLPAGDLPGFNETFAWNDDMTASGEPVEGVMCQPFGLLSIGAKSDVYRTYEGADGSASTGLEVVAEFPDAMTAKRAYSVIRSWYGKCPRDHDGDPHIGTFTTVPLSTSGAAGWQLLTYGTTFDAHGVVQRGSRVAVVLLTLRDAQDYDYEPGQEPMVEALQRAAALL